MKKIATILLAVSVQSVMAMGGSVGGGIGDIAKAYLDKLDINPVVLQLAKTFKGSKQGFNPAGSGSVWNPDLALNVRYECKVFWVLRDREAIIRPTEDSFYNFKPFGRMLLENLAVLDNVGNVRWFTDDTISPGDLIGRSEDRSYFESIRLDVDGSLVTEIQTKEYYYVKYILAMLGRSDLEGQIQVTDFKSYNLALPGVIEQNLQLVLGYAYCPATQDGRNKVNSLQDLLKVMKK